MTRSSCFSVSFRPPTRVGLGKAGVPKKASIPVENPASFIIFIGNIIVHFWTLFHAGLAVQKSESTPSTVHRHSHHIYGQPQKGRKGFLRRCKCPQTFSQKPSSSLFKGFCFSLKASLSLSKPCCKLPQFVPNLRTFRPPEYCFLDTRHETIATSWTLRRRA